MKKELLRQESQGFSNQDAVAGNYQGRHFSHLSGRILASWVPIGPLFIALLGLPHHPAQEAMAGSSKIMKISLLTLS